MARDIVSAVKEALARELGVTASNVDMEKHLHYELHLDGDDFGMSLVPALQKRFQIKPTRQEWGTVACGRDIVALIERHLATRGETA